MKYHVFGYRLKNLKGKDQSPLAECSWSICLTAGVYHTCSGAWCQVTAKLAHLSSMWHTPHAHQTALCLVSGTVVVQHDAHQQPI